MSAEELPPPSRRRTNLRRQCMRRDYYRCVLDKSMEYIHWKNLGEPDSEKHVPLEVDMSSRSRIRTRFLLFLLMRMQRYVRVWVDFPFFSITHHYI